MQPVSTPLALSLAVSLVAASAASAQAGGRYAYAPGSEHYRLTTVVKRSQSGGGGRAPFEFETTTSQLVTLSLAPRSRDTLGLSVTIDSLSVKSSLAAPAPNLSHLLGAKLTGAISPQGRVYSFDPPTATTDAETRALYGAFRGFLLAFPARSVGAGTSWADTTKDVVTRNGIEITTRSVTTSRVTGDTVIAGQRAWRVERRADISQSGVGKEAGQPLQVSGTGTITSVHYMSAAGVYLGSESTQSSEITMALKGAESAPISQTIRSKVELVR